MIRNLLQKSINHRLQAINDFLEASFVLQTVHLFLLDARLAAGVGVGLQVHQDGDDLVAEALLGEAADLQVALGEGGIFFHQPFREVAVDLVDERHEVIPFVFLQVEVEGRGGDLLGEGVFISSAFNLALSVFCRRSSNNTAKATTKPPRMR